MANSKITKKVRVSFTDLFTILKAQYPSEFGTKLFLDVDSIEIDPEDANQLVVVFNEE